METIYGIQADTDTLREAHEHQKRMQSRLQEQQSTTAPTSASATKSVQPISGLGTLKPTSSSLSSTSLSGTSSTAAAPSTAKPGFIGRSTSTSAVPSNSNNSRHRHHHHPTPPPLPPSHQFSNNSVHSGQNSGRSSPTKLSGNSPTANSPFFTAVDYHNQLAHQHAPGQLRCTTQSPAFLAKFYESGSSEGGSSSPARLPGSMGPVPWLSLPSAMAGASSGGTDHSSGSGGLFGRRRSVGSSANASGRSTPVHATSAVEAALTPSLDALHLYHHSETPTPQQQQQHHHLLSHQELAVLSRNNSPMPSLNEALPRYLRKKSVDPVSPMERSFSSPGFHGPASPFMLPMPSTAGNSGANGTVVALGGTGSGASGHSLFTFPAKASTPSNTTTSSPAPIFGRPEMERASSTGVLPMNRPGWKDPSTSLYYHQPQPTPQSHSGYHPHLGLNAGASTSVSNMSLSGSPATATTGTLAPTTASIFRTGTPLTSMPSNLGAGHGVSSPSKLHHPFGSSNDSSKEVHA